MSTIILETKTLLSRNLLWNVSPVLMPTPRVRAEETVFQSREHQRAFWCEVSSNPPDTSSKQNLHVFHDRHWFLVDYVNEESPVPSRSYPFTFLPIHSQETQVEMSLSTLSLVPISASIWGRQRLPAQLVYIFCLYLQKGKTELIFTMASLLWLPWDQDLARSQIITLTT